MGFIAGRVESKSRKILLSQLVMKSGSYTGLFSVSYGLAKFKEIAAQVEQALAGGDAPAQSFALPSFGDLALETLQGE